jgi:S-methylmethionine-dependent homocysteine/selenocysteine methylase
MTDQAARAYHAQQVATLADTEADMITAITMETDGKLPTDPGRIRGLRANASRKSHAELNESSELDTGNPSELGIQHAGLKKTHAQLNVMGGCCGTDHRHIEQIAAACSPLFRSA